MLDEAWPKDRLAKLGPNQKDLLTGMFATSKGTHTVDSLKGLLDEVENGIPERFIPSFPSLEPLLAIGSKLGV
jgi:hypothetical protein